MAADTAPARRNYIVETHPETGRLDRAHAVELLSDLEAVLAAVGGTVMISAQRTVIDRLGDEPVAETTRLLIEWRAFSSMPLIDPFRSQEEEPGDVEAPALDFGDFELEQVGDLIPAEV